MNSSEENLDTKRSEFSEKCECVRQSIIDVILERDDIALQVNPKLEADYAVKIGYLENKKAESYLEMRRAKRKAELAQAKVNSGSPVDDGELETKLDSEFEQWQAELEEMLARYETALSRKADFRLMKEEDARKLKKLYRMISKRLHPDLNPASSEWEQSLFQVAQRAYSDGDLATLTSIAESLDLGTAEDEDQECKTVEELAAELALLEAELSCQEEALDRLKGEFPYKLKDKLEDPEWVTEICTGLKKEIGRYEQSRDAYEEKYESLKTGR